MGLIIIYVAGLMSGGMIAWRVDEWRDYKIERYEQILELDQEYEILDHMYIMEDPYGQIWAVEPGGCMLVF